MNQKIKDHVHLVGKRAVMKDGTGVSLILAINAHPKDGTVCANLGGVDGNIPIPILLATAVVMDEQEWSLFLRGLEEQKKER